MSAGRYALCDSLNYVVSRERIQPSIFGRAAPATGWYLLAEEQEDAPHATAAPFSYMAPYEMVARAVAPESAEHPATDQPFPADKQANAGYVAPQPASLLRQERECMLSWYASGTESASNLASGAGLGHSQGATLGFVGSSGDSE